MSDNYNNLSKDTGSAKADETIKKANIENAALTITNDINKWYSDKRVQKLESRLETNIEQENTDGITTGVDETDGVQTNVGENDTSGTDTQNSDSNINTGVHSNFGKNAKTAVDGNEDPNESNNEQFNNPASANKNNNSKIRTKVGEDQTETDVDGNGNTNSKKGKIQTKVAHTKRNSKIVSKGIKTKQVINRGSKYLAQKGKQLQTASEGNIGEAFSSDLKSFSKRGVGKIADLSTRKLRQKVRSTLLKVTVRITKAVINAIVSLIKSLIPLLIKALPVILIIVVVLLVVVGLFSSRSSVFGENAEDSVLNSYVDYMDNIEEEISSTVDWKAPCAVIYGLDMDIQYDNAEQYILNQFKKANLYVESSEVYDYIDWLNDNYTVVQNFYEQKGLRDNERTLPASTIDIICEYYETDGFMKLIDEKRGASVNTGSVSGSTGDGTISEKFSYPTSSRNISAGFPNYSSGKYHGGVDFAVATGTDVCAVADGKIIVAKELNYSYGHYIIVDHGNGISTLYAHNSKLLVGVGDTVKKGQVIAKSGSTGNSTGPHCHFEVRVNGKRVNPLSYLE